MTSSSPSPSAASGSPLTPLFNAVDYWCNAFTPDRQTFWQQAIENQGLSLKVYRDGDEFCEPPAMVERLDTAGFGTVILVAADNHEADEVDSFEHVSSRDHEIASLATTYPGRFAGLWSVDPTQGHAGVARSREMLSEPWCVGLHNHTHSWDRRFDHPDFTGHYELCAELDVPFVMQAGASGGNFPHECGHPSGIAEPAAAFPTVRFVLSHTGAPWTTETIEMVRRYDNVYLGTATWPPRHWNEELVAFLSGEGRRKVLYASGFPTTGHMQASRQLREADLDPGVLADLTSTTARSIFTRLPDPTVAAVSPEPATPQTDPSEGP